MSDANYLFCLVYIKDREGEFYKYASQEKFKYVIGGGCPWVFVNINRKTYKPGKPGVCFGPVFGNHAVTIEEFKIIWEIYKKYEGVAPLKFSDQE